MKVSYKLFWIIFAVGKILLDVLGSFGYRSQSWLESTIGTFLLALPAFLALYFQSKDMSVKNGVRVLCKIVLVILLVCFVVTMFSPPCME